jgi:D-amino-acid oxidase
MSVIGSARTFAGRARPPAAQDLADGSAIRPYHLEMPHRVAIVGAGVSGLTCGVLFAEHGYRTTIFAEETGARTTSAAAAAIWYPYDAEPADKVIAWALESYDVFRQLARDPRTGVSMIELRTFSRAGEIEIPSWADSLGAHRASVATGMRPARRRAQRGGCNAEEIPAPFKSGFVMTVPLIDTTIYLDYLAQRLARSGGEIRGNVQFVNLEEIDQKFPLIINCSGIGAKSLVPDRDVEPHRGQVAIVSKLNLSCAIVCDDAPLMYAIPRTNDCVFGGINQLSDNRIPDPVATSCIVAECSRVLNISEPRVIAERVGLRPFRKSGVRLGSDRLRDGRPVLHNYGHGGAGFTISWGCAQRVFCFAANPLPIR